MKHLSLLTSVAAVATLTMAGWAQAQTARGTADLIVTNAHIITVDAADTIAQSLAVQGNRILAVGSNAEVMALRGPGTEVMDVGGRTVLPGFIDGHTHVEGMALVETFSLNIQAPPLAGPRRSSASWSNAPGPFRQGPGSGGRAPSIRSCRPASRSTPPCRTIRCASTGASTST